jgi:hypothetical protein
MNRQEIKEFLNKHSEEEIIEYIFTLESDLLKTQRGLEVARIMIKDSVSKGQYNSVIKKYNEIIKKYNELEQRRNYE